MRSVHDAGPILPNKLDQILRNRYYIGYVAWRGVEYPGAHEPLTDLDTFERVQFVLRGHRQSSARPQRHTPNLAGTLYCARCESKLIYAVSTGRRGGRYAYWRCFGQQQRTTDCDLPNLPHVKVEAVVASQWHREQLAPEHARDIRDGLLDDLRDHEKNSLAEAERLDERIHAIKRDRFKWPRRPWRKPSRAREKQRELAEQLAEAERQRSALATSTLDYERVILTTTELIADCGRAYNEADPQIRRAYKAWYERVLLDVNDRDPFIADADRTEIVQAVQTAVVTDQQRERRPKSGALVVETPNAGPRSITASCRASGVPTSPVWWS